MTPFSTRISVRDRPPCVMTVPPKKHVFIERVILIVLGKSSGSISLFRIVQ